MALGGQTTSPAGRGFVVGNLVGLLVGGGGGEPAGEQVREDPEPNVVNPALQVQVLAAPCELELSGQAEQVLTGSLSQTPRIRLIAGAIWGGEIWFPFPPFPDTHHKSFQRPLLASICTQFSPRGYAV